MSNMFDGLITDGLKTIFTDGVNTLLDPSNQLTVRCRLFYPGSTFDSAPGPNLVGKTNSKSLVGSPSSIHAQTGPAQNSSSAKKPEDLYEDVDMIVLWQPRRLFLDSEQKIFDPNGFVDCTFKIELMPKLKRAASAIFDLDNEKYNQWKFIKFREPQSEGLFSKLWGSCLWQRAG